MMFAKIENGNVCFCPTCGYDGLGRYHTNLLLYYEGAADRDGWLEVVETDRPQGDFEPTYTEQDGKIVQSWTLIEMPEPEPNPYKMQSQIDYLSMMTGISFGGEIV